MDKMFKYENSVKDKYENSVKDILKKIEKKIYEQHKNLKLKATGKNIKGLINQTELLKYLMRNKTEAVTTKIRDSLVYSIEFQYDAKKGCYIYLSNPDSNVEIPLYEYMNKLYNRIVNEEIDMGVNFYVQMVKQFVNDINFIVSEVKSNQKKVINEQLDEVIERLKNAYDKEYYKKLIYITEELEKKLTLPIP